MTPVTASSGCQRISPSASPHTSPTGSPRRSSPRAALLRIPPSSRARRMCSSASDMVPFMPSSIRSLNKPRMVDAVGVGDQRVGHPGQVQQPVPVGVVAGQAGDLQRQHDPHLPEPDLGGQLGEPRAAGGAGPADSPRSSSITRTALRGQPSRPARATRSYWRAVDSRLRLTWARVDWRT